MPKLLLINPNTSVHITELVVATARAHVSEDTEIFGATGRFGASYIMSRAASAIAGHAALDAYAAFGADADAVLLACFGDPGLQALSEVAHQPVVGLAQASCIEAAAMGARFAIVTGGASWKPMLEEFVVNLGLADHLAGIETTDMSGAVIAKDPNGALQYLERAIITCAKDRRADVVILGGAGLAGLAHRLAARLPVPLIDSVAAGVRMAEAKMKSSRVSPSGQSTHAGVTTAGLSPELTRLLLSGWRASDSEDRI